MERQLQLPVAIRLLADSTNWTGSRLTSMLLPIPTSLLAQLRTHRLLLWGDDADFSINANSDRAIPITKKIESVRQNLYTPIPSLHQAGMSAVEDVPDDIAEKLNNLWGEAAQLMMGKAEEAIALGASKQWANRLLMPFSWSMVVVTGDDRAWSSFFKLRVPMDVEPNFRQIARAAQALYLSSTPTFLLPGEWHISFKEEAEQVSKDLKEQLIVSASCCARISFANEKQEPLEKHIQRSRNVLAGHTSIIEHQARCPEETPDIKTWRTVLGWEILRHLHESGEYAIV